MIDRLIEGKKSSVVTVFKNVVKVNGLKKMCQRMKFKFYSSPS